MRRFLTQLPSPALIVGVIALVAALGGTGWAASSADHGKSSASAAKKKRHKKRRAGRHGPRGKRGFRGPAGPKGTTGVTGPTGAAGVTGATGPAGSTVAQSGLIKVNQSGSPTVLLANGSLQVQGNCTSAGGTTANLTIKNTSGAAATYHDGSGSFTLASGATSPPLNNSTATTGGSTPTSGNASVSAMAPDGSHIVGQGLTAVGSAVSGNDCAFDFTNVG